METQVIEKILGVILHIVFIEVVIIYIVIYPQKYCAWIYLAILRNQNY